MKVFFDTEFNGLVQNTTLISIGMVAEDGRTFYAEAGWRGPIVDPWIKANVEPHLDGKVIVNTRWEMSRLIEAFLEEYDEVTMVSDILPYDWVLFCDLWGGALKLPKKISIYPLDLANLFLVAVGDPDISRKAFSNIKLPEHNALNDALMIKACFERITHAAIPYQHKCE